MALMGWLVGGGVLGVGAVPSHGVDVMPCTDEGNPMVTLAGTPAGTTVNPGATLSGVAVGASVGESLTVDHLAWLKDGHPIFDIFPGNMAAVTVDEDDLGSTFVEVFAASNRKAPGCRALVGATQAWRVMATAKVRVKLAKGPVAVGSDAVVKVAVVADGVARPTGKVTVSVDNATAKTVWLSPADRGTVDVKLRKLSRGTHLVAATFKDTTGKIQDGSSRAVKVKVK
jgi:hypothetical protein